MFGVTTDKLLLREPPEPTKENPLHLGSIYLVVKDFERSVAFYEKFLGMSVSDRCRSGNKFVEFFIDNKCLALMNEDNIIGHATDPDSPYKFVQNYWVEDLMTEYRRVNDLKIGAVTEIREAYPGYRYFHLFDPDNNVIEITGGYDMKESICQSCGMRMMKEEDYGKNADGTASREYCRYCFPNGKFSRDETLEEMVESCIPFMLEGGECKTAEEAREKLMKELPKLNRWR